MRLGGTSILTLVSAFSKKFHFGSIDDEYERLVKERNNELRSSHGKRPRI
jgi:hypothetical protein